MRQLVWMVEGRKEVAGELVAWHLFHLPVAVWNPKDLPQGNALNPYGVPVVESELMKAFKARQSARRIRLLAEKRPPT